jgi:glycerophosphoryl diester phosphodiesterase
MAAVHGGLRAGADAVEVDVRRTRDGALVLMHDTTLVRTTDVRRVYPDRAPWRLHDFTFAELQRLDAGSWKSRRHLGEPIPQLEHAIEVVRRAGAGLLVEVKTPELYPGVVEDVLAALSAVPGSLDTSLPQQQLAVQSFDFAAMKELKSSAPRVTVGLLGAPPIAQLPVLASWADQINPHHAWVDHDYLTRLRDLGLCCQVWTPDRSIDMRRVLQLGVDGVVSNRPDKLLRHRASIGGSPFARQQ